MKTSSMLLVCLGISSTAAYADNAATATAPAPQQPAEDGMRLRNGFSLSASEEFGSGPSSGLSGQLFGLDWRIGAHINDDYAIYLQTHLSFGNAHFANASGVTADFASALMAERTLPARTFVAGGLGYGVLNNPSGPLGQIRVGWYPMDSALGVVSRRLNVALDARWYFADSMTVGTVTQIAATIGYDRF